MEDKLRALNDYEPEVPIYYSVAPLLSAEEIENVIHVLRITPVHAAITTGVYSEDLAHKLSPYVLRTNTLVKAHELAKKLAEEIGPTVVVGGEDYIAAHYKDGSSEPIATRSPRSEASTRTGI